MVGTAALHAPAQPEVARRRRVPVLALSLTGCVLVAGLMVALTGRSDSAAHLIAFQVVTVVAVVWAAVGAWRHRDRLGLVGALLVAAVASWCIGNFGWMLNILVFHRDPYPSWTDVFFLLVYPALMTAALLMVRRREVRRDGAALIDAAIVTIGIGVVAYAFLLVDAAQDETLSLVGKIVGISYPLCDLLVAGVFIRILLGSAARSKAGVVLLCAIGCLLVADVGFMLAVFAGDSDAYNSWVDMMFALFFLLVGLALQQRDVASLVHDSSPRDVRLGPVRLVALGVGALLAPLTLLAGNVAGDSVKVRGAAVGAGVMFLLAMARMRQLIRAVERNSDLLQVQARTDALTGLPNRRTFDFELDRTAAEAATNELFQPMSVAMIDLDYFKAYNDTFGHGAGDLLLQHTATEWRMALLQLAPAATLARYGGEEFAIILPGSDEISAATVLRTLLPLTPESQSFSAGVAQIGLDEGPEDALRRADVRLYEAKAAGRARVVAGDSLVVAPAAT